MPTSWIAGCVTCQRQLREWSQLSDGRRWQGGKFVASLCGKRRRDKMPRHKTLYILKAIGDATTATTGDNKSAQQFADASLIEPNLTSTQCQSRSSPLTRVFNELNSVDGEQRRVRGYAKMFTY